MTEHECNQKAAEFEKLVNDPALSLTDRAAALKMAEFYGDKADLLFEMSLHD